MGGSLRLDQGGGRLYKGYRLFPSVSRYFSFSKNEGGEIFFGRQKLDTEGNSFGIGFREGKPPPPGGERSRDKILSLVHCCQWPPGGAVVGRTGGGGPGVTSFCIWKLYLEALMASPHRISPMFSASAFSFPSGRQTISEWGRAPANGGGGGGGGCWQR